MNPRRVVSRNYHANLKGTSLRISALIKDLELKGNGAKFEFGFYDS